MKEWLTDGSASRSTSTPLRRSSCVVCAGIEPLSSPFGKDFDRLLGPRNVERVGDVVFSCVFCLVGGAGQSFLRDPCGEHSFGVPI